MTKIKDMLSAEETLFKNRDVFDPEYVPENFLYRDSQLKELASYLKPGLKGSRCINGFLNGPPSTGKTTSIKKIFEEAKEESDKLHLVHVNCQLNSTVFKIFSIIHKNIIGHEPPETGTPLARVMNTISKKISKGNKSLLVVLDDVNFLSRNNMNDIMYKILRAHEQYPKSKTAIWLISTEKILHLLNDRIRSVFTPKNVNFQKYSFKEMMGIMKRRVDIGLYDNVLSKKLLEKIIENSNDLREAIELTKQSVLNAENQAKREVNEKHINKALANRKPELKNSTEQKVINTLKEKSNITSGQLFKKINFGKSYSSFYRLLKRMEKKKLIEMEKVEQKRGKSRRIALKR